MGVVEMSVNITNIDDWVLNILRNNPDVFNKTPIMIYNMSIVQQRLDQLKQIRNSKIYYQIKANPKDEILKLVYNMGLNFDCQSFNEIKKVIQLFPDIDVTSRISFGNTIKSKDDIKKQYDVGVRLFATDSYEDILHIATYQPQSNIFIRLQIDSVVNVDDVEYPLTKKFGVWNVDTVVKLQTLQNELGLNVVGLSFHVGSQNRNPQNFEKQIKYQKFVWTFVKDTLGIDMKLLNIGGGFPAYNYYNTVPEIDLYIDTINQQLDDILKLYPDITIMVEPGRYAVSDQQFLLTKVVLKRSKQLNNTSKTWIFVDTNQFQFPEQAFGVKLKWIPYTNVCGKQFSEETDTMIVQGSSCDSGDAFGELELPVNIDTDDYLIVLSTGQYTTQYYGYYQDDEDGSRGFNGFKPVKEIVI